MKPYYENAGITIFHGDCREVMPHLAECSVSAIVTDPPYGLTANKKGGSGEASLNVNSPAGRSRISTGGGFMGQKWDSCVPGIEYWQACLRVAKPGAHLLAFGGTRTFHRLACAIEDAGYELRDSILWVWCYGSGFPKSLDVSKAIDRAAGAEREVIAAGKPVKRMIPGASQNQTGSWIKDNGREFVPTATKPATDAAKRWDGWGTALKPAWEPIIVGRASLVGTVAENVLLHGTGAINVDACRIDAGERPNREPDRGRMTGNSFEGGLDGSLCGSKANGTTSEGRWPANVIHDGSEEVLACFPETESGKPAGVKAGGKKNCYGEFAGGIQVTGIGDSGSAARFFYCAKADMAERGNGNNHPTVKPLELMRYLVKLVTPPGALILDPFLGSGSTLVAAQEMHCRAIGIEAEERYCEIAANRLAQGVLDFGSAET